MPVFVAPIFYCIDDPGESEALLLTYISERKGLAPIVTGIVKEIAKVYFSLVVTLEAVSAEEVQWKEGPRHKTVWRVRTAPLAAERKEESPGRLTVADIAAASERRASSQASSPAGRCPHPLASAAAGPPQPAMRCPFSSLHAGAASPAAAPAPPSPPLPPGPQGEAGFGLSTSDVMALFPYHVIVDKTLRVVQVGPQLPRHAPSLALGKAIGSVFQIDDPPELEWSWEALRERPGHQFTFSVLEAVGEAPALRLTGGVLVKADAAYLMCRSVELFAWPSTSSRVFHSARGYLFSSVRASDARPRLCCCCGGRLASPQVSNLDQLAGWGLTLSDIPRHDGRRSLVLMGEHLQSEIEMARRLDHLSKALEKERRLNEQLVNRMVPHKVANDLRARRPVPPETFELVTVFFSDIENFTPLTAQCQPLEIVIMLNQLYTVMDYCVTLVPSLYKVRARAEVVVRGWRSPSKFVRSLGFTLPSARPVLG